MIVHHVAHQEAKVRMTVDELTNVSSPWQIYQRDTKRYMIRLSFDGTDGQLVTIRNGIVIRVDDVDARQSPEAIPT